MDELFKQLPAIIAHALPFAGGRKRLAGWSPNDSEDVILLEIGGTQQKITIGIICNEGANIAVYSSMIIVPYGFDAPAIKILRNGYVKPGLLQPEIKPHCSGKKRNNREGRGVVKGYDFRHRNHMHPTKIGCKVILFCSMNFRR